MEEVETKKDFPLEDASVLRQVDPPKCLVCGAKIENGLARKMLGNFFVFNAYESLVKRPAIPPRSDPEESAPDADQQKKQAVAQVNRNLSETVKCYCRGRQIPALGSKNFDGEPFCPDCYFELTPVKQKKP